MFHKEHFCHVSSTNRGCPQYSIYVYKTTDSVETMLTEGYFNGALLDLHKNDVILAGIISDIDDGQYSTAWFRVIKRSLDAIEVEQVLTSADNITYDGTGTNYLSQFDNVQDAISALDAELKKESTERTQGQESLQGQIDGINEKIPETASASNQLATESDINTLQGQIDDNSKDIEALQGAGGALTAYNFGATPTQETLTKYAVDQIWAGNTNWAWNAANPAASTFTDANGVARTAAEIFNSTWVNNTYDDHRWQLTNTQNTAPKVFEWADVGRDIVSVATATTAGIVRVGDGSQMVVNASTGDISLDGSKAESIRGTIGAVATNQGTENAGKLLGVGADGNVKVLDSGGAGRNIGDIFWTTRTDSALNGAVEANGAQYNFADVNGGANNVQALLDSGALPSVSIADYESAISSKGWCDKIGYDSGSTSFRVPKLTSYIVQKENIPVIGNGISLGLTNGDNPDGAAGIESGTFNIQKFQNQLGANIGTSLTGSGNLSAGRTFGIVTDPTKSGMISDLSNDSFTGRVMIQLFNSATDEAVATCTQVLSDVANLNMGDYVIYWDSADATDHSHAKPGVSTPTNHGWYRYYKSGWVEQGGIIPAPATSNNRIAITLPIEMRDANYHKLKTLKRARDNNQNMSWGWGADCANEAPADTATTAYFSVAEYSYTQGAFWEVKGYANSAEYTKDKWDYQNVQVERPMVQLFNSATDDAVATCTEVLADVADLKDLSNITAIGKETVVGWGVPDYSAAVSMASGSAAPSNGWIYVYGEASGNNTNSVTLTIDGTTFNINGAWGEGSGQNFVPVLWPISKNSTFTTSGDVREIKFIPCKGVN